ncbi:MAG: DUF1343 domain-containing protein [Myxococcota bacterium]|nr:DUF1343 domain-containing protein [Myxococcota bacterium]
MGRVFLGIENLQQNKKYRIKIQNRRVGLLAHPASIDASYRHSLDVLLDTGARVTVLFGPEHGFSGEEQDMAPITGQSIGPYGLPLQSLYGTTAESLSPDEGLLRELDCLVVDLFDVGARYYTFVWTAVLCLQACHKAGVELILTDRPNPLGGDAVEGAPQERGFLSFVGLWPVSNRHGLTPGELVSLVAAEQGLQDNLTVIPMTGWRRDMTFCDTGLPWVMPSPNMPTIDTARVYPGLCLIEGTSASEGRGTTRPFELVGATGISSKSFVKRLEDMRLPGVRFRAATFRPGFQKHAGRRLSGVQLHVTEPELFLPYRTGVATLLALKAEAGDNFKWRDQPYEFVTDIPAIDLLTGSTLVRAAVEQNARLDDVAASWSEGEAAFRSYRKDFLLY